MSEAAAEPLYKFTLTTGMEICLREPKIAHTRLASQVAGKKAGDNQAHLSVLVQEEIVKQLLVKVNGSELRAMEKENLDGLFSLKEYNQVLKSVQMIGGDEVGEPVMATEFTGS